MFGQVTKSKIEKPSYYKTKKLPVEKSRKRKNTFITRFYHNITSRYNYYYNAERLLTEIWEDIELYPKVDYSEYPIQYYPYDIEEIGEKYHLKLDTIIEKCNAGILLHDIRSKWQDDFYYMLGQTYYLKNVLDTSLAMFEFLYNVFIPDKKGRVNILKLQSKKARDLILSSEYSVNRIGDKLRHYPKRNDAAIWIIRVLVKKRKFFSAYLWSQSIYKEGLIPSRIKPYISDVEGYWNYEQKIYLPAAQNLSEALKKRYPREERARRNFLVGQLYDLGGEHLLSQKFFETAYNITFNPELEIYARLYQSVQGKYSRNFDYNRAIKELLRLRRKQRYKNHLGLIYYNVALIELQRDSIPKAGNFLRKAIEDNYENISLKNKAYYTFFNIHFKQKEYQLAARFIDSVDKNMDGISKQEKHTAILHKSFFSLYNQSTNFLSTLDTFNYFNAIKDSTERIKEMVKLAQQQVQKNDDNLLDESAKEDEDKEAVPNKWYFDNDNLLKRGKQLFFNTWGNIANSDNWQTDPQPLFSGNIRQNTTSKPEGGFTTEYDRNVNAKVQQMINQYEVLKSSNIEKEINKAEINVGKFFHYYLKEYDSAYSIYNHLLSQSLDSNTHEEVLALTINVLDKMNYSMDNIEKLINVYFDLFPKGKYHTYIEKHFIEQKNKELVEDKLYEKIYQAYLKHYYKNLEDQCLNFQQQFPNSLYKKKVNYFLSLAHIKNSEYQKAIILLEQTLDDSSDEALNIKVKYLLNRLKKQ